jgi:hypothetical protein
MSLLLVLSGGLRDDRNPSALGSQADILAGENLLQPAAAKLGPALEMGWSEKKLPAPRPMLPIPPTAMRTRVDFHKCHVGKSGARIQRPLISGSQVRALVSPPPSPLFWRFAETVEKGPLLAGFFVSAQTDPGLRSRECGNFDPWSPVAKFPFLGAVPIVRGRLCRVTGYRIGAG